jgi:hypothetical protein
MQVVSSTFAVKLYEAETGSREEVIPVPLCVRFGELLVKGVRNGDTRTPGCSIAVEKCPDMLELSMQVWKKFFGKYRSPIFLALAVSNDQLQVLGVNILNPKPQALYES